VETVIGADSSLPATIDRIIRDTGLSRQADTAQGGHKNAVRTRFVR
jgi:hypothetical protein